MLVRPDARFALVLVITIAACGGGHGAQRPDGSDMTGTDGAGPGSDAAIDAGNPSAVHVQVYDKWTSGPAVGLRVLFSNPDDTIAADVMTDANGEASAGLPSGGYVTVVRVSRDDSSQHILTTLLDVHNGDQLEVGPRPTTDTTSGTVTITVPARADNAGFIVYTPCTVSVGWLYQDFPSGISLPIRTDAGCQTNIGLIATASLPMAGGGRQIVAYSYLDAQTLVAGGTIAMPAWVPAESTAFTLTDWNYHYTTYVDAVAVAGALLVPGAPALQTRTQTTLAYSAARPTVATGMEFLFDVVVPSSYEPGLGNQHAIARTAPDATATVAFTDLFQRWLYTPAIGVTNNQAKLEWFGEGADHATVAWTSLSFQSVAPGSVDWDLFGPAPASSSAGVIAFPVIPDDTLKAKSAGTYARFRLLDLGGVSYDQARPTIASDVSEIQIYDSTNSWYSSYTLQPIATRFPSATHVSISSSPY